MNVIEPKRSKNLVRADSIKEEKGFKHFDEEDGRYDYFVVIDLNSHYYNVGLRYGLTLSYVPLWVFNVRTATLGTIPVDRMVEPVELEVIVKGKE